MMTMMMIMTMTAFYATVTAAGTTSLKKGSARICCLLG
jgi:hypothetical protein